MQNRQNSLTEMINNDEQGGEADEWREAPANHTTGTKSAVLLPQQTLKHRDNVFRRLEASWHTLEQKTMNEAAN